MALTRYLTRRGFLPFLLLLFLAIQVPFLEADPHVDIAPTSRDAFTDEGLNTSQLINRVNHGKWVVDECDNLIKTPLFSLWLFPAYQWFGTSIWIGRLWVLSGCLLLLYFSSRKHPVLPWILGTFVILSLSEFHVFQYIRFTMAELTACFLVLAALGYIMRFSRQRETWDVVRAGTFLWAAVFVKNQFAYVLALLPVWIVIVHLFDKKILTRKSLMTFLCGILILMLGGLVYYLAWYLPTRGTYDYVMADQAGGRFMPSSLSLEMRKQAEDFLFSPYTKWYSYFSLLALIGCIANFWLSKNKAFRIFSLLSLAWALLELHKFAMWFVPARYLSPLLFAWGLFACAQLVWAAKNALDYGRLPKLTAGILLVFATGLLAVNALHIRKLYRERMFAIHRTNLMLTSVDFGDRPAVGPWAPTLARETGARVIPVWFGYFNDQNILENLNPKIVISEKDEGDSGGAFKNHGINLSAVADSVKEVRVGRFDLFIYYLP